MVSPKATVDITFLSTPSARRATSGFNTFLRAICISIHALREEGDGLLYDYYTLADLFLSTPSARRATFVCHLLILLCIFLSTPSARRATQGSRPDRQAHAISIHALREEGDPPSPTRRPKRRNFYPRPPRGGRRRLFFDYVRVLNISIHALREEGDRAL